MNEQRLKEIEVRVWAYPFASQNPLDRQDIPDLIAEVRRLRTENDECRQLLATRVEAQRLSDANDEIRRLREAACDHCKADCTDTRCPLSEKP